MTSSHMIGYIRQNYGQWLEGYLADKKSAESGQAALTRLCQRFVERHGFTQIDVGAMRPKAMTATTAMESTNTSAVHSNETVSHSIERTFQPTEGAVPRTSVIWKMTLRYFLD